MKGLIVGVIMLCLTGCYAQIGTQGAIREWGKFQNGGLTVAKAKSGESVSDGYWNNQDGETEAKIWRFKMSGGKNDK